MQLYYPKETSSYHRYTCSDMFSAAAFTLTRSLEQPTWSSTKKPVNKMWYIYTIEQYIDIYMNKLWNSKINGTRKRPSAFCFSFPFHASFAQMNWRALFFFSCILSALTSFCPPILHSSLIYEWVWVGGLMETHHIGLCVSYSVSACVFLFLLLCLSLSLCLSVFASASVSLSLPLSLSVALFPLSLSFSVSLSLSLTLCLSVSVSFSLSLSP